MDWDDECVLLLLAIEVRLFALAEREGSHDESDLDDPEPVVCHCDLCQLFIPALWEVYEERRRRQGRDPYRPALITEEAPS